MEKQGLNKGQGTLGLENGCNSEKTAIPRVNQCFLCKGWHLEARLEAIEVPDQTGYIVKKACSKCLGAILSASEGIK